MERVFMAVNGERFIELPITTEPRTAITSRVLCYPENIFWNREVAEKFLDETSDLRAPGEFGAVPFVTEENSLRWLVGC